MPFLCISTRNEGKTDQAWEIDEGTAVAWRDGHKAMMKMTTEALGDGTDLLVYFLKFPFILRG